MVSVEPQKILENNVGSQNENMDVTFSSITMVMPAFRHTTGSNVKIMYPNLLRLLLNMICQTPYNQI